MTAKAPHEKAQLKNDAVALVSGLRNGNRDVASVQDALEIFDRVVTGSESALLPEMNVEGRERPLQFVRVDAGGGRGQNQHADFLVAGGNNCVALFHPVREFLRER